MWFKKDKDKDDEADESPATADGAARDGVGPGVADESAVDRVGETDGIGQSGDAGVPDGAARVEDVEDGERVDRGESLTDPDAVSAVPPAPRDPEPTDRVGEEPIDADTGAYSEELSRALEDARGADEVSEDEGDTRADDGYQSRHAGGVDDSGVLADAPDSGSGLPGDGAVTDESAVDLSAGADADRQVDDVAAPERDDASDEEEAARAEAERREREEAFAREHDPSEHDVTAGEEFRQRGDWTADEHGGPQVQEPDGTLHDPDDPDDHGVAEQHDESGSTQGRSAEDPSSGGESSMHDIRDGGHGWGSAAPIEGGAQPLGHPVKAWHDTMTYVLPGEPGYEADPHEWFVDGETAQQAGFRPAHGG